MKRTIEIEDTLEGRVDDAIEQIHTELAGYLDENEPRKCPDWSDLDYSGALHEIIDGAVPIYTHEIKAAWFLYDSELEQAYEDAGIGDNPRENDGMAAIFCYIEQKCQEWWGNNAEDIFEAWETRRDFRAKLEESLGDDWESRWKAFEPDAERRREREENDDADAIATAIVGA